MDANLKRSIMLEHYQHPKNKGLVDKEDYHFCNMNNESCIDEVNLQVKIENDKIVDIRFDGEACAICTSATSIMIDTLLGKTKEEAKQILEEYKKMLNEEDYQKDLLEQAQIYEDIAKQPNRKKCALLPWWAVEKILEQL